MKKTITFYLTFLFLFLIIYSLFFFTVHAYAQESGTIEALPGDSDYLHPTLRGWSSERAWHFEQSNLKPCYGGIADCRPRLQLYFVCVNDRWVISTGCPF